MRAHRCTRGQRGFLLLESLLAVAIFGLAVLVLAQCVDNCLRAQMQMQDDDRARRALENRMNEIENGAVQVADKKTEELKGAFEGMKITQSRQPLKWKNEKDEDIPNLFEVTLLLEWESRGSHAERSLTFYVSPRQR
jgi:type II secretory pathway component PulJ